MNRFCVDQIVVFHRRIQICPFRKGCPLQSYDLGMGCFDHQSYEFSGGVWILRDWFLFRRWGQKNFCLAALVGKQTTNDEGVQKRLMFS